MKVLVYNLKLTFLIICGNIVYSNAQDLNLVDRLPKLDSNPLLYIKETPGFAGMFRDWGFIGHSLTSGEHEYLKPDGSKGYKDLYEYSWGQYICYATGAKGTNFSKGGLTCRSWINQIWEKAKTDPKQVYIIELGVNDNHKKYKIGNFTTDVDLKAFDNNADTFTGNYAGIIQRIQSIQPKAKIFICTMFQKGDAKYNESIEQYNQVIREMNKHFSNVYLMDMYKYAPVNNDEFRNQYYNGGHNNAAGYLYSSWILMTYIDWIVRNNFRDFAEIALIGKNMSLYSIEKQ